MNRTPALTESAKAALLWSGGSVLLRDSVQFAAMLVLVRLLTPADYGAAALAQTVVGLVGVFSFGTLALHALQFRDPAAIDWQGHFTAAMAVNTGLFALTLVLAWVFSMTESFGAAALPLAGLATGFLVEIPATLRHRMLETQHEWKRFRLLVVVGTFLGLAVGLVVALLGGGVWALVVQGPLFGLPAAIDLFWHGRWRPDWSWSWSRYRATARFGAKRVGSALSARGRLTVEHGVMSGTYDLAALGIFTRAVGLGTLLVGRIGNITMQALYPVVTRVERNSERFRRVSGLVLAGVCWTSIPAGVFLALNAFDTVALLYGQQWWAVVPLLPLAVAGVVFSGIAGAVSSLLLANDDIGLCLALDLGSAAVAVGLALWLVPIGVDTYLAGMVLHGFLVLAVSLGALGVQGGIGRAASVQALLPPLCAAFGAAGLMEVLGLLSAEAGFVGVRLLVNFLVFGVAYLAILRLLFPVPMGELLAVAPGGKHLSRLTRLALGSSHAREG